MLKQVKIKKHNNITGHYPDVKVNPIKSDFVNQRVYWSVTGFNLDNNYYTSVPTARKKTFTNSLVLATAGGFNRHYTFNVIRMKGIV